MGILMLGATRYFGGNITRKLRDLSHEFIALRLTG